MNADAPELAARRAPVFLAALRASASRVPVWLTVALVYGLLALAAASPVYTFMSGVLEHRYEPGSLVRELDETFRLDQRGPRGALDGATRASLSVLALVAMLVGAFAAGGWLQVLLERTEGHSLRRFFQGGARYFIRFVRVMFLTLLLLALCGWIVYGWPWERLVQDTLLGTRKMTDLTSELSARRVEWIQDGLYFALFALVLAWGDYTRTRLALHDTRSAVWAGLSTFALIGRHPLRTLAPLAAVTLIEAGFLLLAGAARPMFEQGLEGGANVGPILALWILGLYALCARSICKGARYAATAMVSRELVHPIARPDPWKESVGGPGGPRYPLESGATEALGV